MGMDLAPTASKSFALSKPIGLLGATFLGLSALSVWAVAQSALANREHDKWHV